MRTPNWTVALGALMFVSAQQPQGQSAPQPQGLAPVQAQTPVPSQPAAVVLPEISAEDLELAMGPSWNGRWDLAGGIGRMQQLADEDHPEAAKIVGTVLLAPDFFSGWRRELELEGESWWLPVLEFSDPLLDFLRLNGLARNERAHVHYAMSVVEQALPEESDGPPEYRTARYELEKASARAGVGSLREDATYNLGTLALQSAEAWRALMPEFGGAPPAPAAPAAPGAEPETPPEPLDEARARYLDAKQFLALRLRMDWHDADTRANMELVMRRLRELDEIEQQREEQEQEQQDQEQQDQDEQDQDQEDQDKQDPKDQEDPKDSESEDQNQEQPEDQPEPEKPEDEGEEEEPEAEPEQQPEAEEDPEAETPEPEEGEPQQEIYLTKEEVQRLLERLKRHEEEGEELRERRRSQRRPTARDW